MTSDRNDRPGLVPVAFLYLLFLAYGSLVPLDFSAKPLSVAWSTFVQLPWTPGVVSLTDRITNVFLYIPLGFLWRGVCARFPGGGWVWSAPVWVACLALSAGVEFTQTFTISRTPLFYDILMNGLGAAIGVLLWPVLGSALVGLLVALSHSLGRIYQAVPGARLLARLALLPYALSLMWVSGWLTSSWVAPGVALDRLGGMHLSPFYQHYFAAIGFALSSVLRVLAAYAPMGLAAWALCQRVRSGRALFRAAAVWSFIAAGMLEAGKVFLADRQPDFTNVLFAVLGAWIGVSLACLLGPGGSSSPRPRASKPMLPPRRPVRLGWRVVAVIALIVAVLALWAMPFARVALACGAALYVLLLSRYPQAWLVVVPALLPVLDLAPWSGRFFFDEFDLALLLTVAVGYWHHAAAPPVGERLQRGMALTLALFAVSSLISLAVALFPLAPLDPNSFSSYYSPYNALRVVKGLLWSLALLPILLGQVRAGFAVGRLFSWGMVVGLAGLVLSVLWERAVFPGLTDFSRDFRVAGLISSMHTGGSHIEALLVLMLPFLAAVMADRRGLGEFAFASVLLIGGLYAMAVTYARGGYAALGVASVVLAVGFALRGRRAAKWRALPYILGSVVLGVWVLAPIIGGQFAQGRIAESGRDAGVRLAHWEDALLARDEGLATEFFGMGLGRYPATYFYRHPGSGRPASFAYFMRDGEHGLSLGAGTPVYVEQKVSIQGGAAYRLSVSGRSAVGKARLNVLLCERTFFDSFGCQSATFDLAGAWSEHQAGLAIANAGSRGRPVTLSLENPSADSVAEVRRVSLLDPDGHEVVSNGDFSRGADRWFFSTFDHLPWHIKNLWVALLFEQGWLGVMSFALLAVAALSGIGGRFLRSGDMVSLSALAGFVGFMTVGAVDSLFDAPRLGLLFFLTVCVASLRTVPWQADSDAVGRNAPAETGPAASSAPVMTAAETPSPKAGLMHFLQAAAIVVGSVAALALVVVRLPGVPYNVRELVYEGSPIYSTLMLAFFWLWFAGAPVLVGHGLAASPVTRALYLPITFVHAAVAAILVTTAVPTESAHDLVGSPVQGWPGELEVLGRMTVLLAALSILLVGGAWVANAVAAMRIIRGLVAWAVVGILVLALGHWVVVELAATDNLTELMSGGGGIQASVALAAAVFLFAIVGSLIALRVSGRGLPGVAILACVLLVLPVSYGLLKLGTEAHVLKYGQDFAALQFLLSTDRAHLTSGAELLVRYAIAAGAGLLALAFAQWPFVRLTSVLQLGARRSGSGDAGAHRRRRQRRSGGGAAPLA